jgi:epoxide hydrolase 4
MIEPWTQHEARVNGIRLHWVEQGEGPLVVLLHGFPEFWYAWRHQLPALAAAGFRAVAPDLRGYNLSDKPAGVAAYRIEALLEDLARLIERLGEGRGKAHVVGHDWGGAFAWYAPLFIPERLLSLTVLNAPHPLAFRRELKTNAVQRKKSSYVFFFQLPWLPERRIRAENFAVLEKMLRRDPAPGTFTDEDIRLYMEALARPGALTAAVNYYRAAFRFPPRVRGRMWPDGLRTLLIWGERDRYLGPGLLGDLDRWVPSLTVERIPHASHWVQADAPARVNELLIRFLTSVTP